MPSLDTLATIALVAVVLLAVWGICRDSTEGALPRYLDGYRYHRAGLARHAVPAAPVEPSALATIPDALNTVRTPA